MTEKDLQDLETAARIIVTVLERHRVRGELCEERRALLRFVPPEQTTTPDVGTPSEEEKGFVQFTEKEIEQMPKRMKGFFKSGHDCVRWRRKGNGYEIRFRKRGYNISASGPTLDIARANFLYKLKYEKPNDVQESEVPDTFTSFAKYYFENFRKEKVAEQTYRFDVHRFERYLQPHFGEKNLRKIVPIDCKKILDDVKGQGKGKTADELYSLMSIIFKGAIAHGIISRNPLDTIFHVPHERESGKAISRDEETQLFKAINGTIYETAAALTLYCGLRPCELKTARVEDEFLIAVNSKRKTRRVEHKRIYACDKLREHLPQNGKIYIPDLNKLRAKLRDVLPGHKLYDLRTTFNTRCKELGVADAAREHFMGHSLGALGNAYTDLSNEYLLLEGKKLNTW